MRQLLIHFKLTLIEHINYIALQLHQYALLGPVYEKRALLRKVYMTPNTLLINAIQYGSVSNTKSIRLR